MCYSIYIEIMQMVIHLPFLYKMYVESLKDNLIDT